MAGIVSFGPNSSNRPITVNQQTVTGASASDVAYGASWDGSQDAPTKNAVYDKIEAVVAGIPAAYTDEQAQDAVGGMVNATLTYVDGTPSLGLNLANANTWAADQSVPDEAYGVGWNASVEVPTKNAVYDKIEAVVASIPAATAPGGSDTQVQFNNAGAFGGDAGLAYTAAAGLVGNDAGGTAVDLRWEGDTLTHLLFVDASLDRIAIGHSAPSYTLDLRSSGQVQAWIGTAGSTFGYTIGRNTSTGFLDILGNQGGFSGINVDKITSAGAITIGGNAVISNWASTLGIGNGSGTPNGTIEIRSSSNSTPNLSMGGGATSNYNFRRNTSTGYLEISGVQAQYTGYLFSTGNYTNVFTIIDGVGAVFNETGESVLDFRVESDTDANNFFVDASANANGFGTNAPSAKVHIVKTTEQLRIGYDASNYYSVTVGSTGGVTFDAVGSGAAFAFSDAVTATQLTSSGLTAGRVTFAGTAGILTDDADFTFATDTLTATKIVGTTSIKVGTAAGYISSDGSTGATGTFTTVDLKTVTVKDGIVVSIV